MVVGPCFIEALLYADDLEVMAVKREGRVGAVMAYVALAMVGAPMKWKKQRGGMVVEWVGINTDYREYSLGLTQRRRDWVVQWIDSLGARMEVHQCGTWKTGIRGVGSSMGAPTAWAPLCVGRGHHRPARPDEATLGRAIHPPVDQRQDGEWEEDGAG